METRPKVRWGCLLAVIAMPAMLALLGLMAWFGSTEVVQWDHAARSNTVTSYQEYLARCPNGSHVSEARSRLAALAARDKKIRDAAVPAVAALESHAAPDVDSYTLFLKNSRDPSNTVEAAERLDRINLWSQLVSNPSPAVLFAYLKKYSSSSSRPAKFFRRDRWIGRPYEVDYIEALRSSDPERRVWYVNDLASEEQNALLFTPYLIPLLDDPTSFRVMYGPAIGSKNEVGTTSLSACAYSALKRITGRDFGYGKEEWVRWWNGWWSTNRDQLR
jgi:hypothetical protein